MSTNWDKRFIGLAKYIASWSKDPSTQTGAVIVDKQKRIISVGFNGLPQGIKDKEEILNNRDLKYKIIIHCEINAQIFAERSIKDCILYTWPFMSCSTCASRMIQAGIKKHIAPYSENPRWIEEFKLSSKLFKEAGVELKLYLDESCVDYVCGYNSQKQIQNLKN